MAEDLIRAVERLEAITARLDRVMFGDSAARAQGILDQMETLTLVVAAIRNDLQIIHNDVQQVKHKRHNAALWIAGYVAFVTSGAFAISAFNNLPQVKVLLDVPGPVAMMLAVLFAIAAAALLMGGFGWFNSG